LLTFGAEFVSSGLLSKNIKIKIYTSIILCVLYGCETRALTLMGECRLRVFKDRVLRPKRGKVTREWRKLCNKELDDLYCCSPNIWVIKSRRI
jgi:hypothetical protein